MPLLHIAVLAGVQGLTEFLPISSSAHLILVPKITGWPDQGPIFDVAVHVGTLGAVLVYFWRDAGAMARGVAMMFLGRFEPGAKTAALIVLATLPVLAAGYYMHRYYPTALRGIEVIGWATLGFGVLLFIADKTGMTLRRLEHVAVPDALLIGLAQVLALIPGASRAGVTMTAARFLGMERSAAARFSMLLSIPAIIAAGALKGLELYHLGVPEVTVTIMTAALLACVIAFIAIALMMAWLRRAGFTPFVFYRVILGGVLLAVAYGYI